MRKLLFFIHCFLLVLCESKAQEGFVPSPLGFKYKMHTANTGKKVEDGDIIEYHQYMRKGDSLIQSTRLTGKGKPLKEFITKNTGVIILEALRIMSVGDSMTLAIVIDSLGSEVVFPSFKSGEILFLDIKMLSIKTKQNILDEQKSFKKRVKDLHKNLDDILKKYKKGKLKTQITASGLKYLIIEQGTGQKPELGKPVSFHYIGGPTDDKKFEDSFERDEPVTLTLGQNHKVKGFDEAIALLNVGGKAVFFIPSDLAYGATPPQGSPIKPNAELVFYVELVK
jgi:FKBP-type peptidyl-prolyl cis-trans isomerase FkpA